MNPTLLRLLSCLIFLSTLCHAQKFPVDTLQKTGPLNQRINVVILGDGYTEEEMAKFDRDANQFMAFFMTYDPYKAYKDYFNFFSIKTPSKQSGATNPGTAPDRYPDQPIETKDTFYGATFGTSNIHRLVTIRNYQAFSNVMATNFPSYDLTILIVNTRWYGGSGGGNMAVFTTNSQANLIGVHEIGHAFTGLSDEYFAGAGYGRESANMTRNNNPATIKWKNWLNQFNVGIHSHTGGEGASSWYKPTTRNCMMEVNGKPLCAVCQEATANQILQLVKPVLTTQPVPDTRITVKSTPERFRLSLLKPNPNTLKVEWWLNDVAIGQNIDEVTIANAQLTENTNTLRVTVLDTTAYIRLENHRQQHLYSYQWALEKATSPIPLSLSSTRTSLCAGESATLSVKNCPGKLNWSTGDTTNTVTVSPTHSTAYSARCRYADGAMQTATLEITVFPLPVAKATNTGPYLEAQTVQLSAEGGTQYRWHGPINFISSEQNPTITAAKVNQSGVYTVDVTDSNGCMGSAQTVVSISPVLSVAPPSTDLFRIFPNPARSQVQIQSTLTGELDFVLFDNAGHELLKKVFQGTTIVSTEHLPKALYVYRVSNGKQTITGKLLVE